MVNIEPPQPWMTFVTIDVDCLHLPGSTTRAIVLGLPYCGHLPLEATASAFDICHRLRIAKTPAEAGALPVPSYAIFIILSAW